MVLVCVPSGCLKSFLCNPSNYLASYKPSLDIHEAILQSCTATWGVHSILSMMAVCILIVCTYICVGEEEREGTAFVKAWLAHEQSFSTKDIPNLQCVVLQGRTVGDSCSLRSCEPKSLFGGRPACLQLCLLRPWESSQTSLSLSSSHWRGIAPNPFYMPMERKQGNYRKRNWEQLGIVFLIRVHL